MPCAHDILLDFFASEHTLPKIARGLINTLTVLKGSHPLKLFQLYKSCDQMRSPILQASAKQKLSNLCAELFHIRPTKVISFRINTFEPLSQNKVKTILFSFLKTLPISPDMLSLLQLQTRVIFTGHPKISKILCNHISWCKRWTLNPFPCSCSRIAPLLNITLTASKPHISTLGHDTTSKFDHVLHSNLNNVCVPNIQSFPEQFLTSFLGFYDQVNFFTKTFMEPIMHVTYSPSQHLFKNKAFDRIYSIFSTFNTPPKFVLTLISQLDQYATSFTPYSPSPYISEVNQCCKNTWPKTCSVSPR